MSIIAASRGAWRRRRRRRPACSCSPSSHSTRSTWNIRFGHGIGIRPGRPASARKASILPTSVGRDRAPAWVPCARPSSRPLAASPRSNSASTADTWRGLRVLAERTRPRGPAGPGSCRRPCPGLSWRYAGSCSVRRCGGSCFRPRLAAFVAAGLAGRDQLAEVDTEELLVRRPPPSHLVQRFSGPYSVWRSLGSCWAG